MNGLPNCVAEGRLLAMQRRERELNDLWDWLAEYMDEHGLSADDVRRAVCRVERMGSLESLARLSGAVDVATGLADSCAISSVADAMRELAGDGRFRIVEDRGRRVLGYWPDRDPLMRRNQRGV